LTPVVSDADSLLALASPEASRQWSGSRVQPLNIERICWMRVVGDLEKAGGFLNVPRDDRDGGERWVTCRYLGQRSCLACPGSTPTLRPEAIGWFQCLVGTYRLRHAVTHGSVDYGLFAYSGNCTHIFYYFFPRLTSNDVRCSCCEAQRKLIRPEDL
jgi:hypothetical protein